MQREFSRTFVQKVNCSMLSAALGKSVARSFKLIVNQRPDTARFMGSCGIGNNSSGSCGNRPAYTEEQKQKLKARLSPEAYAVTQESGTERPFTGKYNKHYDKGLYKCIVCEAPLFPSSSKFNSGTGWPSFWQPFSKESVKETVDHKHGMARTEVQCANCSAHLGHVFNDGPKDKTGLRYCINSVSLEFQKE